MNKELIDIADPTNEYIDIMEIKKELVRLSIIRRTGQEPNKEIYKKFLKYLDMSFENNNSKSNIDRRIASVFKAIEKKYDDYIRIYNF